MKNAYSLVCEMFNIYFDVYLPALSEDHIRLPSVYLKDYIANPSRIRTAFVNSIDAFLPDIDFSNAQWENLFSEMESNLVQLSRILDKHNFAFYEQIYNLCSPMSRISCCLSSHHEKLAVYTALSGKTGSLFLSSKFPFVFEELCSQVMKSAELCKFAAEPPRTERDLLNLITKVNFYKRLNYYEIRLGENAFLLDNHKYLVNDTGKYRSGLTFIVSENNLSCYEYKEDTALKQQFNVLWDGTPYFMFGKFWVSQKGTRCFEVTPRAKATHILTKLSWGGAFNRSRGNTELPNALYIRNASSNGGGAGNTYFVSDITNYVSSININDI